MYALQLNLQLL